MESTADIVARILSTPAKRPLATADVFRWRLAPCGHWTRPGTEADAVCSLCTSSADAIDDELNHQAA
jgi:hypothetical protein